MNKIPNRQAICQVLMDEAQKDRDIVVLCSDSRGSASLALSFCAGLSGAVCGDGYRGAGSGQRFCRVLQNAGKEHLRHLRRASFLQEAMSRRKWMWLTQHKCEADRNQRGHQLRCSGDEPSLCTGYRCHDGHSKYACVPAQRPFPD